MALLTCPDCEGKVSDQANSCPHCGRPMEEIASDPAGLFKEEPKPDTFFLKSVGSLLFLGGLAFFIYYFFYFDTTVATESIDILGHTIGGNRVYNIGLMEQRRNGLFLSGGAAVVGILLVLFADRIKRLG